MDLLVQPEARRPALVVQVACYLSPNRTQFLHQRRKMMQSWANYLDRVRAGADVVPLRRSRSA